MDSFEFPKSTKPGWEFVENKDTSEIHTLMDNIVVLPSEWTHFAINLFDPMQKEYVNFPFTGRRYLTQIYDCGKRRILFLTGRQAEKSTSLGNIALTHCCLYPFFHVLYVAPTSKHVTRFSKDRLEDTIAISPKLRSFTSKQLAMNVLEKGFINQSRFILRYCYNKPDSVRGIRADLLLIDEIASIITDHVPIIEECLSHSTYKKRLFAGTPLVMESAAGYYWSRSTQNEWAIPCTRHTPTHWNIVTDKNLGLTGVVCDRCGELINPRDEAAQWVSMTAGADWESFRLPQVLVPDIEWEEVLHKKENYPTQKFKNEVMADFADVGGRPVTRGELVRCSQLDPGLSMDDASLERFQKFAEGGYTVYAGLDWGTGDQGYTVIVLGSYFGSETFKVFYIHRFSGPDADPLRQLNLIEHILKRFRVRFVGADYGFGFVQNAKLQDAFADQDLMYMQFYYSLNPKKRMALRGPGKYVLHRSQMMSNLFHIIKRRGIAFPKWEQFETYASDFLNVVAVYDESARMIRYDHSPDRPDDTVHATLYCMLASFPDKPRRDLMGIGPAVTIL